MTTLTLEDHFGLTQTPFPKTASAAALLRHPALEATLERLRFALHRDTIASLVAETGRAGGRDDMHRRHHRPAGSRRLGDRMTPRPRLRLPLPPLSPRDALTLSYLWDRIDDLLWLHYGDAMVDLLNQDTSVPGTSRSARRDRPH